MNRPPIHSDSGFTLIELMVSLVVASVVLAGAYGLLVGQVATYRTHQDRADTRLALRNSLALLAWEIRHAASSEGDIYAMDSASVTVRTTVASGVVCRKHATLPRYGLTRLSGSWNGAGSDTVMVFGAGASVAQDDAWRVMPLTVLGTPAAFSVDPCSWSGGEAAALAIEVAPGSPADTASVRVGAPVRLFRSFAYHAHQQGGKTWLARSAPGSATPTLIAGPLTADGLRFSFFDSLGVATTDSSAVRAIEVTLRVERPLDGSTATDSLVSNFKLRN